MSKNYNTVVWVLYTDVSQWSPFEGGYLQPEKVFWLLVGTDDCINSWAVQICVSIQTLNAKSF